MLRKILFFIFLFIFALAVILPVYHHFRFAGLCQTLTQEYFQNPPSNPIEYSSQQESYDELCGSGNGVDWGAAIVGFVGMVITAKWRRKAKPPQAGVVAAK